MVRKSPVKTLIAFCVLAAATALQAAPMKFTLTRHDQDRRFVLAEKIVHSKLAPPFKLTDDSGKSIPCQYEPTENGHIVRWLITDIAAGATPTFTLDHTDTPPTQSGGLTIKPDPSGS